MNEATRDAEVLVPEQASKAASRTASRVALGAHMDCVARIRDALGRSEEAELLVGLLEAVGSATGWGRRPVDDICGEVLSDYQRVLRGPA